MTRGPQARTPPARKAGPQGLRALCPAARDPITLFHPPLHFQHPSSICTTVA